MPRAEPSGHFADRFELTSRIEPLCVRITYDMECGGTQSACASGAIVNERPTDALPLRTRIDKQGVELNRAVLTALERSKADDLLERGCRSRVAIVKAQAADTGYHGQ